MIETYSPFDLSGRTVLVTGASSGIGRETAVVLTRLGSRVVVTGRRPEALDQTREIAGDGCLGTEPFDLVCLKAIPEWVERLAARYGPFDGLVHAAGMRKTVPLRATSPDLLQETFGVNLDSAFMLAKGFRQKGCCQPTSSIVFLSSVSALAGAPGIAAYAASKAALIGLTRSLSMELAQEGIRVNCIAPGIVDSEMTQKIRQTLSGEQFASLVAEYPLGLGTTRDVACAAAYLISEAARWMTGHTLVLDGGFSAR